MFRFQNEYFDHSLITISVCQSELQAYLQNMIELDITANEVLYGICTLVYQSPLSFIERNIATNYTRNM